VEKKQDRIYLTCCKNNNMKRYLLMAMFFPFLPIYTNLENPTVNIQKNTMVENEGTHPAHIKDIELPAGFSRVKADKNSFAEWLGSLKLKENKTVYLYNGQPKRNQTAQFAVIDISVGNKDLQQCADAVMRMRAEYLYAQKRFDEIVFWDNNKTAYRLSANQDRKHFDAYLENVFYRCGTASLEKQLKIVQDLKSVKPGDVLIKGGFPGHAMMVMDMAKNNKGKIIYLLAQSYMPAQDIHIVVNPFGQKGNPWYELNEGVVVTPEWVFPERHFRAW